MDSLGILLPLTSRGGGSLQGFLPRLQDSLRHLGASFQAPLPLPNGSDPSSTPANDAGVGREPRLSVCLGIDEDDPLATAVADLCPCFPPGVPTSVLVFPLNQLGEQRARCGGAAPLCWMWGELARHAQREFAPQWLVLLGDDTRVQPAGWPGVLAGFVSARAHLRCVALIDSADPGFPSFPVVASTHLELFGRMLPDQLGNQGGDPLLYELYRGFGAAAVCPAVTVRNGVGGPQGTAFASPTALPAPPRYERCGQPVSTWRGLLKEWQAELAARQSQLRRRMQVAVAVPTVRVDPSALGLILERCACCDADVAVRVLIQVDNPAPAADVLDWLQAQQGARLDGLRVRLNPSNLVRAREHRPPLVAGSCLVQQKVAVIFLDDLPVVIFLDDDVAPAQRCVGAYVAVSCQHPQAAGFAGPTYLPRKPTQLLPTSIHMSDVSFFWEAPATLGGSVPWAVTANMAVRYTHARFRDGFPKTGGGEDVDFCIQLGSRLVAVPDAVAEHPWWPQRRPKIYTRFWGWAWGDSRLLRLWPGLTYRRAPNPVELCTLLLLLAPLMVATGLLSTVAVLACLLAMLGADLAFTVLRNCCQEQRRRQHPCSHAWMRPLAAAEAWVIAALFSEGGRLAGHLRRGHLSCLSASFDWFCGMLPEVVVEEQRRAARRCACCLLAAAAAAWLVVPGGQ